MPRFGLRRHFKASPWTDLVEVHWAAHCEAYVTPVADDVVGVAVLGAEHGDFEAALHHFPRLSRMIAGAEPISSLRGAGPLRQAVSDRVAGRVLLVGDAAGYVDALTGEGLAVGFASAQAAIDCIVRNEVGSYDQRWRSLTRKSRTLTHALLWAQSKEPIRGRIVPAAERLPFVFTRAVNTLADA